MAKRRFSLLVVLLISIMLLGSVLPVQAEQPVPTVVTGTMSITREPLPPATPKGGMALSDLEGFWQGNFSAGVTAPQDDTLLSRGLRQELLAKAKPDECFKEIGYCPIGGPNCGQRQCDNCTCSEGKPKVNQAYVWGLTMSGQQLWFGTAANVLCLVFGGYLGMTTPQQTGSWVCEFGQSCLVKSGTLPPTAATIGDWRPPLIYTYDLEHKQLTTRLDKTTSPLLATTMGIRSAGSLNNVALMAGPGLAGGVNFFAFDATTGKLLGQKAFPQYNNIRKWIAYNGVLYTGVEKTGGGGAVLRWNGNATTPFVFEEVGTLGSQGAELAVHQGRLAVTTWPSTNEPASLYISPVVPSGGLTSANALQWTKLWQATDYDPDPVTARTYGGGALASFDGYLYWGTMHVPFVATLANVRTYASYYGANPSEQQVLTAMLGTHRAISIFRGRLSNDGKQLQTQVVYGERYLPTFVPPSTTSSGGWTLRQTKMGRPLWGHSGFGNFFNNYTWTMGIYRGKLYVGTMDWSYLLKEGLPLLFQAVSAQPSLQPNRPTLHVPTYAYGADLWAFSSARQPASAVSTDGLGNYANYGIRTMLPTDQALYLGTANPMNLLTDPNNRRYVGGWELIKLTAR